MISTTVWPRSWNSRSFCSTTVKPRWISGAVGSMPSLTRSGRPCASLARRPPSGRQSTALRVRKAASLAALGVVGGGHRRRPRGVPRSARTGARRVRTAWAPMLDSRRRPRGPGSLPTGPLIPHLRGPRCRIEPAPEQRHPWHERRRPSTCRPDAASPLRRSPSRPPPPPPLAARSRPAPPPAGPQAAAALDPGRPRRARARLDRVRDDDGGRLRPAADREPAAVPPRGQLLPLRRPLAADRAVRPAQPRRDRHLRADLAVHAPVDRRARGQALLDRSRDRHPRASAGR